MPNVSLELPYDGTKGMLSVDNVDSKEFLRKLFEAIYEELAFSKGKRKTD